jgi:hypothetical protein
MQDILLGTGLVLAIAGAMVAIAAPIGWFVRSNARIDVPAWIWPSALKLMAWGLIAAEGAAMSASSTYFEVVSRVGLIIFAVGAAMMGFSWKTSPLDRAGPVKRIEP